MTSIDKGFKSFSLIFELINQIYNIVSLFNKKLVPSMSWEVIEFFRALVFQPNCVVILGRINTKRNYLESQDLSFLVLTCFSIQSSCAILYSNVLLIY